MNRSASGSHEVFLSHSSKDKAWADAACAVLEGRRVRCWVAPRDIAPGTEWGASIIKGIDACRVLVLILSAHSNSSGQVRREVERAISKGLAVLPFRVEEVTPDGALEYAIGNTHWLDAFSPPVEHKMELLADSVEALLGRMPSDGRRTRPTDQDVVDSIEQDEDEDDEKPDDDRPGFKPWAIASAVAAVLAAGLAALVFSLNRDRGDAPATGEEPVAGRDSAGPSGNRPIDLLRIARRPRDRATSTWSREEESSAIVSSGDPQNPNHADVIQFPYRLPTASYRLEMTVEALRGPFSGRSDFQVGLAMPTTRAAVVIGGWSGRISGISQIRERAPTRTRPATRPRTFTPGPHEIRVTFNAPRTRPRGANPGRFRRQVAGRLRDPDPSTIAIRRLRDRSQFSLHRRLQSEVPDHEAHPHPLGPIPPTRTGRPPRAGR